MPRVSRTCQECGATFQVLQSWLDYEPGRGQFCSKHCHNAYRRRQSERVVVCLECGNEFKTQQHFINRGEAKFCSQSCAARFNNRKRERNEPLSKEFLEEMYYGQNLSMVEIAERLGCSSNKVVYWMDKYGIERRDVSEAIYQRRNPDGDPFDIRRLETEEEREFFQLTVGLYIGEGNKKTRSEVSISNTDPRVVRAFIQFLSDICGVKVNDLFAGINVFDDVDLEEVQTYWETVTGLPRSQFHKPTVRPSRGGTYTNKSKYGTVKVGIYNTKLHQIIQDWCDKSLEAFE